MILHDGVPRDFPTLAAGNTKNMKWKKYFYRKLCEAEGFRHAPHRIAGPEREITRLVVLPIPVSRLTKGRRR